MSKVYMVLDRVTGEPQRLSNNHSVGTLSEADSFIDHPYPMSSSLSFRLISRFPLWVFYTTVIRGRATCADGKCRRSIVVYAGARSSESYER